MITNREKLINLIVIVLVVSGLTAIGFTLIDMKGSEVSVLVRKIVSYSTVPFGLLIKAFSYVAAEREKLLAKLDSLGNQVADNRQSIEISKASLDSRFTSTTAQIANLWEQIDQLGDELKEADRSLDRRLVVQEARLGLQQRIGELETSVNDIRVQLLSEKER